jgi:hypothetical protein
MLYRTCSLRRDLESLLDGGDGAVEVGVARRENASEDPVEEDVGLFVGEPLEVRAAEAPDAAGGLLGDGQLAENVLEATSPGRRARGRSHARPRRRRRFQELLALGAVPLVVRPARRFLVLCVPHGSRVNLRSSNGGTFQKSGDSALRRPRGLP